MSGSSPGPAPECWEPPVGGAIAEPLVPRLIVLFGLRECRFESFPFDVQLPRIEPGRIVLPSDEPGISPWSLAGVELPVRFRDLTLGRYVLVPASPTTGVHFSPERRAEAISMVAPIGALIAEAMIGERDGRDGTAPSWIAPATSSRARRDGHEETFSDDDTNLRRRRVRRVPGATSAHARGERVRDAACSERHPESRAPPAAVDERGRHRRARRGTAAHVGARTLVTLIVLACRDRVAVPRRHRLTARRGLRRLTGDP